MMHRRGLCLLIGALVLAAAVDAAPETEEEAVRSYLALVYEKLEAQKRYPLEAGLAGLNGV